LGWWDSKEINGVKVTAVPSYHLSCRPPFHFSRDYQGYIIETEKTFYHAGDCGMRDYFKEIKKRFKIDVAFLPIGAYYPFRRHHLSPEDALEAIAMIMGARGLFIPIHWGTYKVSSEPFDEPPKRLEQYARQNGMESRYRLLQPGESIDFQSNDKRKEDKD
jgi:L-ascorbate metabolism protein UlaG (beta-lactamase superfamily)